MAPKRSYEEDLKAESSPTKRAKRESPQTPGRHRAASRVSFATPATPYTPYPLQPSDSPSNPFKRKKKITNLPPVSSFSKHVALRFQFSRRGISPIKGGVHRIVQLPLNYTFSHLRALIAWLFDTPAKYANGKSGEEEKYLFEVKTKVVMESMLFRPGMIRSGSTSVKVSNVRDPWHARYGQEADDEDELTEEESEMSETEPTDDAEWVWADEEEFTMGHVFPTGVRADRGVIYHHSPTTQIHITPNATKLPRRVGKSNVPYIFSGRGRVHLAPRPLPRPLFSRPMFSSSPAASTRATRGSSPAFSRLFEDDLSDTDADGEEDVKAFDRSHPFFQASSSPRKPKDEVEVILVDDSDEEETDEEEEEQEQAQVQEDSEEEADQDGDEQQEDEDEEESDDETQEAHDIRLNPDRWNASHFAFGRYFLSFFDRKARSYDHLEDHYFEEKKAYDPFDNDDDEEEEEPYVEEDSMHQSAHEDDDEEEEIATPELTTQSSHTSSSLPPSSPPHLASSSSPSWHLALMPDTDASQQSDAAVLPFLDPLSPSSHQNIIASHYPNKKYTVTPAPPKARKYRLRIDRLEKRLEKVKKTEYLCECDEDVEEARAKAEAEAKAKAAKAKKKGANKTKAKYRKREVKWDEEEVDELDEEEDVKWVKPILKPGEVWDPFGDEEEV